MARGDNLSAGDRRRGGAKGGAAQSAAKRKAAQQNGRKGGRPRKPEVTPPLVKMMAAKPQKWTPTDGRRIPSSALKTGRLSLRDEIVERSDSEQDHWYELHDTCPLPRIRWRSYFFRQSLAYRFFRNILIVNPNYQLTESAIRETNDEKSDRAVWAIYCALKRDDLSAERAKENEQRAQLAAQRAVQQAMDSCEPHDRQAKPTDQAEAAERKYDPFSGDFEDTPF